MTRILAAAALLTAAMPAIAQTQEQVRLACKQFIERQLHDPRDADLREWTKGVVTRRDDGLHVVSFRGRAKNQYGALSLAVFECVIRHKGGDDFTAVSVKAR